MERLWEWVTYRAGLATATMAALSLNEFAILVGIVCTIVSCGVNWYYQRKKYMRDIGVRLHGE